MAKNLNSVTFTVLLLVLMVASTEILKIEADRRTNSRCLPRGCTNPVFSEECGPEPFTGSNNDCCHCCIAKYGKKSVCKGVVEGSAKHCHCYKESV
ncbi:defensin-like protein 206 [Eutrema salsugineum]|uniref:defensin-like protein 206 n=1 Tax=Eutrema salsugineum TaxID=72664 RepID=UPI000CED09DA|nr:defensin-like protein 206 [Eutrema salsugineum]